MSLPTGIPILLLMLTLLLAASLLSVASAFTSIPTISIETSRSNNNYYGTKASSTSSSLSSLSAVSKQDDDSSVVIPGNTFTSSPKENFKPSSSAPTTAITIEKTSKIAFEEGFDRRGKGGFNEDDFDEALSSLDLDATPEERRALFSYLDSNGDGFIDYDEFASWYASAVEHAESSSTQFRNLLMSRRTVHSFENIPVSDDVLRRAIECAIMAPNRSGSEPWRFIKVGTETVQRLQDLNEKITKETMNEQQTANFCVDQISSETQQNSLLLPDKWTEIPGWCIVTSKRTPDDPITELRDFRSTSCAMQNFMLSMWSEGVGSKWTEGPVQKTQDFANIVGIDTDVEKVIGIIWYGFSNYTSDEEGGDPKQQRKKGVDDVLITMP